MIDHDTVQSALREVLDPEMPINIVDLGIVAGVRVDGNAREGRGEQVAVDITPTFVGCPALDVLRENIVQTLRARGAADVRVQFVNDPVWSVERISDAGREALRLHGVTVPRRGAIAPANPTLVPLTISAEPVACPYCGDRRTHMESRFGPTRCRTIYYCDACRNQFEHMKAI